MSVYHSSFNYLGINSRIKNLIVVHFDGGDSGEIETGYQLEPIYTDSALGHRRYDYGSKYSSVATFCITVMKPDGSDMSEAEVRGNLKWLTGTMTNTQLELLVGEQIKCSFVGRITNVWQQKLDARTVGLVLEFTSSSPFGYSSKQIVTREVSGSTTLQINNLSDDLQSYVYLKTKYTNKSGNALTIENTTLEETTKVNGLALNETVTIDGPMTISSDNTTKLFGDNFNFIYPRIKPGINELVITGNGTIEFEFIYPMKLGNVALNIDELDGAIDCDSNPDFGTGVVVVEHTAWENIWGKPTTAAGFGITDVYTKTEIDAANEQLSSDLDTAKTELSSAINSTKTELNQTIETTKSELNSAIEATNTNLENTKTTLETAIQSASDALSADLETAKSELTEAINSTKSDLEAADTALGQRVDTLAADVYTKEEIDTKVSSVYKYIGSVATEDDLPTEGLVIGYVYNVEETGMNAAWNGTEWDPLGPTIDLTPYLTTEAAASTYAAKSDVYTKTEIDTKLEEFVSDDVYTKAEIDAKLEGLGGGSVDEEELNAMLTEVLGE